MDEYTIDLSEVFGIDDLELDSTGLEDPEIEETDSDSIELS
jgi:hypothetical protein